MGKLTARQRYAAELKGTIDDIVTLIDGLQFKADAFEHGGQKVPVSDLCAPIVCHEDFDEDGNLFYVAPDIFDLWPMNARSLWHHPGGEFPFTIRTVKTVDMREARGRITRPYPRMLRTTDAWIRDGVARTKSNYFGLNDSNKLFNITNRGDQRLMNEYLETTVQMMASVQLTFEYSWRVRVKAIGSNFPIDIPTNAEGARRLLSLRDVAPGKERRDALRHWVRGHVRRVASAEGVREVEVSEHLRGITPFKWEDLEGFVSPSPYELREAARATDVVAPLRSQLPTLNANTVARAAASAGRRP